MLNSGKKIVLTLVLCENKYLNEARNHNLPCKLNGRSLTELLKFNIQKSSGLDGISPNILKMSATVIYESLTHIFNLSVCTGNFPSKLKLARVTPLYKSGDIADMNNNRPIISTS
jgi:hypothetical protein